MLLRHGAQLSLVLQDRNEVTMHCLFEEGFTFIGPSTGFTWPSSGPLDTSGVQMAAVLTIAVDMHFAERREAALPLPVMTMEVKTSPDHCYCCHTLVAIGRNQK